MGMTRRKKDKQGTEIQLLPESATSESSSGILSRFRDQAMIRWQEAAPSFIMVLQIQQ